MPNDPTTTTQPDLFGRWVVSVAEVLGSLYELSSVTAHNSGLRGTARELFVSQVLERLLPQGLHVGSGEVLGEKGERSNQIDIVVYSPELPLLTSLADSALFFVEGVIGALEIKTRLTSETLLEALENGRSVRRLEHRLPGGGTTVGHAKAGPATYVFGYRGYSSNLNALKQAVRVWMQRNRVNNIVELPDVVATQGCVIIKNDGGTLPRNLVRAEFGDPPPLLVAAKDPTPLRWLLQHLVLRCGRHSGYNASIGYIIGRGAVPMADLVKRSGAWGKWSGDEEGAIEEGL